MMMTLNFNVPKNKKKIYIVCSGVSSNRFDFKSLNYEDSIIITMNASIELVEHVDFYMMGDWLALRKALKNNYKGARIICRHGMGTCNIENALPSEKVLDSNNLIDNLTKINENLLMHHAVFMKHDFPLELFTHDNPAQYCLDNWLIPTYSLSGTAAMALAFIIEQTNPHIEEIIYIGLDSIFVSNKGKQEFLYSKKLEGVTLQFRKHCALKDESVKQIKDDIQLYSMQVFNIFNLCTLSERFYNKLKSKSILDIRKVPFERILYLRNEALKFLKDNNRDTIKKYPYVDNAIHIYQKEFKLFDLNGG